MRRDVAKRQSKVYKNGRKTPLRNMADSKPGVTEPKAVEKDPVLAEITKRIEDAFGIFDHESNKTVDVR